MKKILLFTLITGLAIGVCAQAAKPAPAPAAAPAVPAPVPAPAAVPEPAAAPAPAPNPSAVLDTKEAEQTAATTEAGKYERKSVTYINALWLMDKKAKELTAEQVTYTLDKVKTKIMMDRFDYNPLPDAFVSEFVAKANAQEKLTIDNIAGLMDSTIVPKILAIVDLQKELRAQSYTTEAQKNSFYATKAKEFGFTDVEIAKIMNAAFIFIPVAANYKASCSGEKCASSMDVGILWYRISTKGEKPVAKLVVKKMTGSSGMAKNKRMYVSEGKPVDAATFCFRSLVKNAARNLLVATQEMPEFRLSGQVVDKDKGVVGFDLGKKEGLQVDQKFSICELEELADGSVKQTNAGWVSVKMVADSNSKEGYKSKAQIITGDPMAGAVLSEFPRLPIDIGVLFRMSPGIYNTATKKDVYGSGMGIQIDARYNVGRYFRWPQLFAGVGYALGGNGERKDASLLSSAGMGSLETGAFSALTIFALQRFYIKRFTVGGELAYESQSIGPLTAYSSTVIAFGANLGAALTPSINFEAKVRYESGSVEEITDWDHSGLGIQAGVVYSPAALPFDPVDYVRGRFGF
ncbi:MAG: hypothetical protein V1913_08940 [Fibrobacterota bacterium]